MISQKTVILIIFVMGLVGTGLGQPNTDSLQASRMIRDIMEAHDSSFINETMKYEIGNLFNTYEEFKYVRYTSHSHIYIQVYPAGNNFEKPIFDEVYHWTNYVSDSIFDINGDEVSDISIRWYPSSGCCPANVFDCFIFNPDTHRFSETIKILNPTFFPDSSTVYSMSYDHPGETTFYKLNWTNNEIDTVKSFKWKDKSQEFVIVTDLISGVKHEIDGVPYELKNLQGIDWFMIKPN